VIYLDLPKSSYSNSIVLLKGRNVTKDAVTLPLCYVDLLWTSVMLHNRNISEKSNNATFQKQQKCHPGFGNIKNETYESYDSG